MQVNVLFFGVLKDRFKRGQDVVSLPDHSTLQDLLKIYQSQAPEQSDLWPALAFSVNRQYAPLSRVLQEGDEVALLPPVSGGKGSSVAVPTRLSRHCLITTQALDAQSLLADMKQGEDGAVIVFEGVVRNHTRGRRTLFLDYEAYDEMALEQMEGLVCRTLDSFKIRDLRIHHRVGRLRIGEVSLLIAVTSEHRGAAFDACRFAVDTLKKTVPIWKKEYFEDGAVWADGEPFPDEVRRPVS